MTMQVEGVASIMANLNHEIDQIEGATQEGLWDAGLQIQRAAQKRLRPSVVTGNLRASAYTRSATQFVRVDPEKLNPEANMPRPVGQIDGVEIGFTANYALPVHENMEGRSPKFLEYALRDNEGNIVEIIKRRARVQ